MGELIALFIGVVIVASVGAGVVYRLNARRDELVLAQTPVMALEEGQRSAALAKATTYYRIAQRAVRELDGLKQRDEMVPFLTDDERVRIQRLLDEFYTDL
jgi:hypothetical protein